jgi:hypothetical protein
MEVTGLSYWQILGVGLPLAIPMWIITFLVAKHVQKSTKGIYAYSDVGLPPENYQPSQATVRATWTFLALMTVLIGYGVYIKAGANFAAVVMIAASIITGMAGGLKLSAIFDSMMEGCGKLMWLFFIFIFFHPFLDFISRSGGFDALVELLTPYIEVWGKAGFALFTTLIGIFGISAAAVAEIVVLNDLFRGFLEPFGVSMGLWALILIIGSQITSYAYPGADMLGQMGLANSKDVKSQLKLGYSIITVSVMIAVGWAHFF